MGKNDSQKNERKHERKNEKKFMDLIGVFLFLIKPPPPNSGPLSAPPGRTLNFNQVVRSRSANESDWMVNKVDVANGNIDGEKPFPPPPPERRFKAELGVSVYIIHYQLLALVAFNS